MGYRRLALLPVLAVVVLSSVSFSCASKAPPAKPTPIPVTSMASLDARLAGVNKDLADLASYYSGDVVASKQQLQSLSAISQQLAAIDKRLAAIETRLGVPTPTVTPVPVLPKPTPTPTPKPVSYFVPSVPHKVLGSAVAIPATIGCDL